MKKTVGELQTKENFNKNTVKLFDYYLESRQVSFEEQLSKLQPAE